MSIEAEPDWRGGVPVSVPVSVVIPAHNAAANLERVLPLLPERMHEVILVDDHSTDETVSVSRRLRPDVYILRPHRGTGKVACLRTGFGVATGQILVTFGADGAFDPREIPRFVGPLLAGGDYVKGSRFLQGGGTVNTSWQRQAGDAACAGLVRLLFGGRISDPCYGYAAFWRRILPVLRLDDALAESETVAIETVMNVRALQAGLKVVEVPSFEAARSNGVTGASGLGGSAPREAPLQRWPVLRTIWQEWRTARSRPPLPQAHGLGAVPPAPYVDGLPLTPDRQQEIAAP
jgi:hypothetical protein